MSKSRKQYKLQSQCGVRDSDEQLHNVGFGIFLPNWTADVADLGHRPPRHPQKTAKYEGRGSPS